GRHHHDEKGGVEGEFQSARSMVPPPSGLTCDRDNGGDSQKAHHHERERQQKLDVPRATTQIATQRTASRPSHAQPLKLSYAWRALKRRPSRALQHRSPRGSNWATVTLRPNRQPTRL